MKKALYCLLYAAAATSLAVALIACTLTAFDMHGVNYIALITHAAVTALVFCAASVLIRKAIAFTAVISGVSVFYLTVLAIIREPLYRSMLTVANTPLIKLHTAYSWIHPVENDPYDINLFLICFGMLLAMIFSVSMTRFRRALPVAVVSIVAVMPCYLLSNTPPHWLPLTIAAVIVMSLFMLRFWHRHAAPLTPAAFLSAAALITVSAMVINTLQPVPSDQIQKATSLLPDLSSRRDASISGVEFAEQEDLSKLDSLNLSEDEELRVSSDQTGGIYLKDSVYTVFNGTTWQKKNILWEDSFTEREVFGNPFFENYPMDGVEITANTMRIRETIARERVLYPYNIETNTNDFFAHYSTPGDDSLTRLQETGDYGFSYYNQPSFTYLKDGMSVEREGYYLDDYNTRIREQYLQLPDNLTDYTKTEKAFSGIREGAAASKVAEVIQNYFAEWKGRYTTTNGKYTADKDYLRWFHDKREGWCIHYATAATLMLRQLHIPARLVTGYKFYMPENPDGTLTGMSVKQKSRHAWAEYYDEDGGWTPLDVTPGQGDNAATVAPGKPEASTAADSTQSTAPAKTQPSEQVTEAATTQPSSTGTAAQSQTEPDIQPTTARQATVPAEGSGEPPSEKRGSHENDRPPDLTWLIVTLLILLCLALAVLTVVLRRRLIISRRAARFASPDRKERAVCAFRHLQRMDKYLNRSIVSQMQPLAEKAVYSRQGISESEWQTLYENVKKAERLVSDGAGRLKRIWLRYGRCLY